MPEGPEVKTVCDKLKPVIVGFTIEKLIASPDLKSEGEFLSLPVRILDLKTRGKKLIFVLEGSYLVSGLGMTGRWTWESNKHTKLSISLSKKVSVLNSTITLKKTLYYNDIRNFGKIKHMKELKLNVGKDVLQDNISLEEFKVMLAKKKRSQICSFLLDQEFLSGIGNYLKSEILYMSRIHPKRKINTLNEKEIEDLLKYCIEIPKESYKCGGLTINDWWSPDNSPGVFPVKVYDKNGERDENGFLIQKDTFADGRGSFFVPELQIPPL